MRESVMAVIYLVLLTIAVSGFLAWCNSDEEKTETGKKMEVEAEKAEKIQLLAINPMYLKDYRTGLCFAAWNSGFTRIPCNLIEEGDNADN